MAFQNCTFKQFPPNFHQADPHSDMDFIGAVWPKNPSELEIANINVRNYQRLKQLMEGFKRHEDELNFFALEMEAQRFVDGGWRSRRGFVNLLYSVFSDYGRSIARPLGTLIVVVCLAFAFLTWTGECALNEAKICTPDAQWSKVGIGKSMGLALTSAVGFLPLKKEIFGEVGAAHSAIAHVIMSVEAVLSAILLFLAGLGLRNRFRMK